MSAFKDAVQEDLNSVFLNLDEFAETHTVYYDGEEYPDVPLVLTGLSEKERRQTISDHAQGLYRVNRVLHCDIAALGGKQPEKDCKLGIPPSIRPLRTIRLPMLRCPRCWQRFTASKPLRSHE